MEQANSVNTNTNDAKLAQSQPATKTEGAPVETSSPPPAKAEGDPNTDSKLRYLAKREREIFRRQQQIKQYESGLTQKAKEAEAYLAEKAKAKENPVEALKALGWSYDQITNFMLNDNKRTPEMIATEARQEVENLRKEQQEKEKQSLEQQKQLAIQEQQSVINNYKAQVGQYLDQNADKYETLNSVGEQELVFSIIEENFLKNQTILSTQEAADIAEKYYDSIIEGALKAKKWQSRLKPQDQPTQTKAKEDPGFTLTNGMASASSNVSQAKSEEDRMKRAMAALDGVKK